MTRTLALLAVLALGTAGAAQAQTYDPIESRKAGQALLSGDFAGIRAVATLKGDVKTLENPAKAMSRWIKIFVTLFPNGSDKGDTKALPAIWTDMAGFQKAGADLAAASDKLAELAKAGDVDGVTAQIKVVGDACAACHRTYRAR